MKGLGLNIRRIREAQKLTIDDLVKRSGVSKGNISKIENSVNPNPRIDTLYKIARAFGGFTVSNLIKD